MANKLNLCLIQCCSGKSWESNLRNCSNLIEQSLKFSPNIISLPEVVNLMDRQNKTRSHFQRNEDPFLKGVQKIAKSNKVNIHIGSLGLTSEINPNKQVNRSFWINSNGEIIATYDKIHLFDVNLGNCEVYRESDLYESGSKSCLINTRWGIFGLTICFDIRFPELFRKLAIEGSSVIFVPAAFTKTTGEKHWHNLLKARAIECHSYIVAAAQGGLHEDGRSTFGHSLVASPEGKILAEIDGDQPGVLNCEIDLDLALECRRKIPSLFTKEVENQKFSDRVSN